MIGTPTPTVNASSSGIASGQFGDGSDGDATIGSGTTTLTRDMYYDDLTIQAGGYLSAGGYVIYVKGVLTVQNGGRLGQDGNHASGATGGAALAEGSLGGGSYGGAGTTNSYANNGGEFLAAALGGQGGQGGSATGAGGNNGGAGGSRGSITTPNLGVCATTLPPGRTITGGTTWVRFAGGTGGGSGGGSGSGTTGAGGGGGGCVEVYAREIVLESTGYISSNGGNGGNASGGNAGGGAGGGGGFIKVVGTKLTGSTANITATGGSGGSPSGTGTLAGASGNAGTIVLLIG